MMKRAASFSTASILSLLVGVSQGLDSPLASGQEVAGVYLSMGSSECGLGSGMGRGSLCCGAGWCVDDYRPKPWPRFCLPPTCGRCDDYCPKPLPRIWLSPMCGACDDYLAKPFPNVSTSWPCRWPHSYECPPPVLTP